MSNFSEIVVTAENIEFIANHKRILQPINLNIEKGKVFIITGHSGSGKTTLAKILGNEINPTNGQVIFQKNSKTYFVSQQDDFTRATGLRTSYYAQRYESLNEEGIPTVGEYVQKTADNFQEDEMNELAYSLGIASLMQHRLLSLSNGERKRVQLAVALLKSPNLLILDQPFIGLDIQTREKLGSIFQKLKSSGITVVITSDPKHIPDFADAIIELNEGKIIREIAFKDYSVSEAEIVEPDAANDLFFADLEKQKIAYEFIVGMKNVNVFLGGKHILDNINWEVKSGEKWILKGQNGAGKTTLLSLITADNPQGYNNDLVLFDRKRGSGESIWDIKKKIGFVSPELHLYFLRRKSIYRAAAGTQLSYNSLSCLDAILSGLKDEVGFNTSSSEGNIRLAKQWLRLLKMEHLEKSPFLYSSLGEQRIILLARALIKTPDLLILDEPCQGLDPSQTKRFINLLDLICENSGTTMIYVTHLAEEMPSNVTHQIELESGVVKSCGLTKKD